MRTVKWNPFLSGVCAFLGGVALTSGVALADVTSTNAAAILIYPKLLVDTTAPGFQEDTLIQMTNTSAEPVNVRCYYVNANGHCSNTFAVCNPNARNTCGPNGLCIAGWIETDFAFRLSPKQPLVWQLSKGLPELPLAVLPGPGGFFNTGSIPPAPEDPMIGELKCVEVDEDERPVNRNSLVGEATIEKVVLDETPELDLTLDSRGYNALGVQAAGENNGDDVLLLNDLEYNACPNLLVLDHFFDDAVLETGVDRESRVRTKITFVPCSEDFLLQRPVSTVVQFLVYNEYEQRFSTSRKVTCLTEIEISDIDTRFGPADDRASIFNVNVQGTLTGQTVMRGVVGPAQNPPLGNGILAIAEECHEDLETGTINTAAYALVQRGKRTQPDFMYLSPIQP